MNFCHQKSNLEFLATNYVVIKGFSFLVVMSVGPNNVIFAKMASFWRSWHQLGQTILFWGANISNVDISHNFEKIIYF